MTVFVVGSLNQDVILDVPAMPRGGETLASTGLTYARGGKGMNQAVASSLAGGVTALVGCVGSDSAGESLLVFAGASGVDVSGVQKVDGPSGTAHILRSETGDNCIVITAGANARLESSRVAEALADLSAADIIVVQGEVPLTASETAIRVAVQVGARVVVNLAPVVPLSADALRFADPLVVNEVEASSLIGVTEDVLNADPVAGALVLAQQAVSAIVTLGPAGAVVVENGVARLVPAPTAARVVDTTGAGDAFVGVLAARLSQGRPLVEATSSALAAATDSVSRPGAADSYRESFRRV